FNKDKFKELVLFFAVRGKSDEHYGHIKLNKLLFLADFWAYRDTREAITGSDYLHQDLGPAPKQFVWVIEEMANKDKSIAYAVEDYYGYPQKRIVATK